MATPSLRQILALGPDDLDDLRARLAALEARIVELEARPELRDGGVWKTGTVYEAGTIVTHRGGGWFCRATHLAVGEDISHDHFRLFVRRMRHPIP